MQIVMFMHSLSKISLIFGGDMHLLAKKTSLNEQIASERMQELIKDNYIRSCCISTGNKNIVCYLLIHDMAFTGLCDHRLKKLENKFDCAIAGTDKDRLEFIQTCVYM